MQTKNILWFETSLTDDQLKLIESKIKESGFEAVVIHGIKMPMVISPYTIKNEG